MKELGIGLLGFGTVGAGVVDGLRRNADLIAGRLGARPVVKRIADLDVESDRGVAVEPAVLTRDAASVVNDPDVDIVVELIGGTGVAHTLVRQALECGKPVVTANKALLAETGFELFDLAARNSSDIYFGASVGGGIPIIRALSDGLIANRVLTVHGILNGTCNYILTRMEQDGVSFDVALKAAQAAGYAEADPGLDIDGHDTAHKAAIIASMAYGASVNLEKVHVEGIRSVTDTDIRYAGDLGYRIKLLAVIKASHDGDGAGVEVRVHPTMVHLDHILASVSGVFNAVLVDGDLVGQSLYYGRGAGREPTASTVIADIADAVRDTVAGTERLRSQRGPDAPALTIRDIGQIESRYYLRLSLLDRPGVLARIAAVLGEQDIGIASVLQKDTPCGDYAPAVIVTHSARESAMDAALSTIEALDSVDGKPVRFRIEG